jgi:putative spermidine/putrescine transport system ATP-binding protein
MLSIRPEKILLRRPGQGLLDGRIASRFFLGSTWLFNVETPVGPVAVSVPNQGSEPAAEGDAVSLGWTAGSLRVERSNAAGTAP